MDASAIGDILAIAEEIPGYSYRQTIMKQAREGYCHVVGKPTGDAATIAGMKRTAQSHRPPASPAISYAGYRFPPDVISYAVWLYYRFR